MLTILPVSYRYAERNGHAGQVMGVAAMTVPGEQPSQWSAEGQANPWAGQPGGYPAYNPPPPPPPLPPPRRRSMWVWVAAAVAVALVGLVIWGAIEESRPADSGSSASPSGPQQSSVTSGETKVVTASDQKSQLTVPISWKDVPPSVQNELASIQLGDLRREQYILVVSGNKADFDNFEGFWQACVEEAKTLVEDAQVGEQRQLTVGGLAAVQHRITGKANGVKIVFWYTMVEGKRGFYEMVGWTLPSREGEAEPVISKVIESFRELGGG